MSHWTDQRLHSPIPTSFHSVCLASLVLLSACGGGGLSSAPAASSAAQLAATANPGSALALAQGPTLTVLYAFKGGADGANPYGGLIQDVGGNLYSTTSAGGAFGFGTVFKLDTSGQKSVLHSFAGPPDGSSPSSGLVRDAEGNLFG